jgi:hypothetical protein
MQEMGGQNMAIENGEAGGRPLVLAANPQLVSTRFRDIAKKAGLRIAGQRRRLENAKSFHATSRRAVLHASLRKSFNSRPARRSVFYI